MVLPLNPAELGEIDTSEVLRRYEREWKLDLAFLPDWQWVTYDTNDRKPRLTSNIIFQEQ